VEIMSPLCSACLLYIRSTYSSNRDMLVWSCCASAMRYVGRGPFGLFGGKESTHIWFDASRTMSCFRPARYFSRNLACACYSTTRHCMQHAMDHQKDDPVAIVGAGLAGSLMAVYLAKRGFKVEAYERRPDMRKEAISAGRSINLALSVRGTTALAQAGISEEVLGISIPMRGRMVHPLGGSVNFQPYSPDYEKFSLYSVSRGMLNMKLIDIAEKTPGINFHFDSKCAGVDFAKKEVSLQYYLSLKCSMMN
jgi:hypothetical protein